MAPLCYCRHRFPPEIIQHRSRRAEAHRDTAASFPDRSSRDFVEPDRIVKLTATSEKGMKRSKRSHCHDRVAPLVGCLGSEDSQRGA